MKNGTANMPNDLIEDSADPNLVAEVKEAYYTLTKREHQRNMTIKALDTAAEKAALICQRQGLDPFTYVKAQIKFWTPVNTSDQFYPQHLATKNSEANVLKYINLGNEVSYDALFNTQLRYLKGALVRTKRTLEEILLDDCLGFEPWFRCLISDQPIPTVIKTYGYRASQQLKSAALLDFIKGLKTTRNLSLDLERLPKYWDTK
jgi:hypothetical protein